MGHNKIEEPMNRRDKIRASTQEEIKTIAIRQMSESGTAGLSLSAIARQMELSAPALYRYYTGRDDLITALVLDAYNALADALGAADATCPPTDYAGRLYTVLLAYRQWAVEHPIEYQLIYGNPIPGYAAPADLTIPTARRTFTVILTILAEARAAGALRPTECYATLPDGLTIDIPLTTGDGPSIPPELVYLGLAGWARLQGLITLELYHHIQPMINDPAALYRAEIRALMVDGGLSPPAA
jgi:AcrR family transcriptional regulator